MFILKIIKNSTKLSRIIILITLLPMLLIAGGSIYLHYNIFIASNILEDDTVFVVNPGSSVNEVLVQLKNEGIISSNKIAKIYYKIKYNEDSIKAGDYIFSDATIEKVLNILITGEVISNEIKIVIPEGYNVFQIANLLKDMGLIEQTKNFLNSSVGLEGYLFPDTYQFKKSATIKDIQEKLVENFDIKAKEIIRDLKNSEDVIILASLLEKEVFLYLDRQVVAGIMQKRIEAGMPLQIDATVLYAYILKDYMAGREISKESSGHNPVSLDDLALDSPYNTYKYRGLPQGPICNPGVDSISAVMNVVETDYWYYLNAKDGTTIFSKTYEEHLANKAKYLR